MNADHKHDPQHFIERKHQMFTKRRRAAVALLAVIATVGAGSAVLPASATTTVDPSGPVVRDDTININVDPGGQLYTRTTELTPYAVVAPATNQRTQTCVGMNATGVNNSPRSSVIVQDPGTNVILSKTSPLQPGRDLLGGEQPVPTDTNKQTAAGGFAAVATLLGNPAGTYTVTTKVTDAFKTGTNACEKVDTTTTQTFEYRPWQLTFHDLLGGGDVKFNTNPIPEFQTKVSGVNSSIITGALSKKAVTFFSLPSGSTMILPNDPAGCAADPQSCLPSTATTCVPSEGCTPALAIVNFTGQSNVTRLLGIFDLQGMAFAALVSADRHTRVLASGGVIVDSILATTMPTVLTAATANGLDSVKVLNTLLTMTELETDQAIVTKTITLLQAIQLQKNSGGQIGGVSVGGLALQAGLVIASWSYSSPEDLKQHYGFTSEESQLSPSLPSVAGLISGHVQHNVLHVPSNCKATTTSPTILPCGSRTAGALNADTAGPAPFPTSPTGSLPIWIPVETTGSVRFADMEFVGYNTLTLITASGSVAGVAVGAGTFLGVGAALFGKTPLPINLSNVPVLWDNQPPTTLTVVGLASTVIATVAAAVLGDPNVAALQAWATAYRTALTTWQAYVQAHPDQNAPLPPFPNPPLPGSFGVSAAWLHAYQVALYAYITAVRAGGDPSTFPLPDPTTFPVPDPTEIPGYIPPVPALPPLP